MKKKGFIVLLVAIVAILLAAVIGGSFYLLDYSLAPDPHRANIDSCYTMQFKEYPETKPWVDSLRQVGAWRDTFVVMPHGERHHALFVNNNSRRTAIVVHGWRNCGIDFLYLARIYEKLMGYNVVIPDLHAHGLSEGEAVNMGWLDRQDVLHWMSIFQTDTMVVHGVSMGGATTMMVSGEPTPAGVQDIRFIDDCGYTSVWDEFKGELKKQFSLPPFPLMHTASLLCQLRYGWNFQEASAVKQVKRCKWPMLFIHGDEDSFVPTWMVYELCEAKPAPKEQWITTGTEHALSYKNHKAEYINRIISFCQ